MSQDDINEGGGQAHPDDDIIGEFRKKYPISPERQIAIDAFKEAVSELLKIDLDELLTKGGGFQDISINFSEALPYANDIKRIFKRLNDAYFADLNEGVLKNATDMAFRAITLFHNIKEFIDRQPQRDSPQKKEALIAKVKDLSNDITTYLYQFIAYAELPEFLSKKHKSFLDESVLIFNEIQIKKAEMQEIYAEGERLLNEIRGVAAKTVTSKYGKTFGGAADKFKTYAKYWLMGVGALIVVLIAVPIVLYWLIYDIMVPDNTAEAIQIALLKIFIISVLYFALVTAVRIFRANKHNEVLNRHRQNALDTFDLFVGAAKDEATKNAVLLKTTETIFSPSQTGYLVKEAEPAGASQVLEIIRDSWQKGENK